MDEPSRAPAAMGQLPPMHCLLAFESVARNRSLGKAAAELGLTRTALTQSISLLEHRVKLRLVHRYAPTLVLTPAGRRYLEAAQAFARSLRDGLHERSPIASTQLRVSVSQGFSRLWLAPRLGGFLQEHPRIQLLLTTTDPLESVLGDGVDVGLRYGGPPHPQMVSVPLWTDRLLAVGSPEMADAARLRQPRDLVREFPLIEHPAMPWHEWLGDAGDGESACIEPGIRCVDVHFAVEAAGAGIGLAIAPARLVAPLLQAGRLRPASPRSIEARPYHAVMSVDQRERRPVRAFIGWLQAQAASSAEA